MPQARTTTRETPIAYLVKALEQAHDAALDLLLLQAAAGAVHADRDEALGDALRDGGRDAGGSDEDGSADGGSEAGAGDRADGGCAEHLERECCVKRKFVFFWYRRKTRMQLRC